jgi:hypothetical protein
MCRARDARSACVIWRSPQQATVVVTSSGTSIGRGEWSVAAMFCVSVRASLTGTSVTLLTGTVMS